MSVPGAMIPRRSALAWGVRAVLALAMAWAGYVAVTRSLAYSRIESDPERGLRLAPGDARIAAQLSRLLILADPDLARAEREEELALRALWRDPTSVQAVATLGLLAHARGDIAAARRRFAYADLLSRRDLVTRLWLIEDAVRRGDAREALRHYDIALRTADSASATLFPILAAAASDPELAAELARTLAGRPPWGDAFATFAAASGSDPEATARLFGALAAARAPVPAAAQSALVDSMVARGNYDAAWRYYASVRRQADRSHSRDPRFAATVEPPSRLDWVVSDSSFGIAVTMQRSGKAGLLDFTVPPTVGGQLAGQVQLLPPGSYRLEGRGGAVAMPGKTQPYWVLKCLAMDAGADRELGRVDLPESAEGQARFAGRFAVPPGCPVQLLALMARVSDDPAGVAGRIREVRLRPAADHQDGAD